MASSSNQPTSWPETVGMDALGAEAHIRHTNPAVSRVVLVRGGKATATADCIRSYTEKFDEHGAKEDHMVAFVRLDRHSNVATTPRAIRFAL